MRMRMLFDQDGQQHMLRDGRIDHYEFMSLSVDTDLAGYLVRNRGWALVDIDINRRAPVSIRFYTPAVHAEALAPVLEIIAGAPGGGPVSISYWYGGWAHEVLETAWEAMERIEIILDRRNESDLFKQTVTQAKAEADILSPRIRKLKDVWNASHGVLDVQMLDWMSSAGLMDRSLMVELQDEFLIYRYFGAGFRELLGSRFCEERIDTVQDGSGSEYAKTVVRHYYSVISASEPYYDGISTSLPDRNRDDDNPLHYRYFDYERGLFPCMTSDGSLVIIGHTENIEQGLQLS